MAKHQKLFEDLIKGSQENTEKLLETYFRIVNEPVRDSEVLATLSELSDNLASMQNTINHQIKCAKTHK